MKRHSCSKCASRVRLLPASGGARGYICDTCNHVGVVEAPTRTSKYGNERVETPDGKFDSKAEAERYKELVLMEKAGFISQLARQKKFPLTVNGVHVCDYVCDFFYLEPEDEDEGCTIWRRVIEDVKGVRTQAFIIKKKLMMACYAIDILETGTKDKVAKINRFREPE